MYMFIMEMTKQGTSIMVREVERKDTTRYQVRACGRSTIGTIEACTKQYAIIKYFKLRDKIQKEIQSKYRKKHYISRPKQLDRVGRFNLEHRNKTPCSNCDEIVTRELLSKDYDRYHNKENKYKACGLFCSDECLRESGGKVNVGFNNVTKWLKDNEGKYKCVICRCKIKLMRIHHSHRIPKTCNERGCISVIAKQNQQ